MLVFTWRLASSSLHMVACPDGMILHSPTPLACCESVSKHLQVSFYTARFRSVASKLRIQMLRSYTSVETPTQIYSIIFLRPLKSVHAVLNPLLVHAQHTYRSMQTRNCRLVHTALGVEANCRRFHGPSRHAITHRGCRCRTT